MKHTYKILLLLVLTVALTSLTTSNANAAPLDSTYTIEELDNGYYYETIIETVETSKDHLSRGAVQYITKTKTTNMKNSSGTTLWSVSITATFSYNGSSATCISCTPDAKSYASTWTIDSVVSNRSGNSATATAVATHGLSVGISESFTKSVTITCSGTGVVS